MLWGHSPEEAQERRGARRGRQLCHPSLPIGVAAPTKEVGARF